MIRLKSLAECQAEPLHWLWSNRIPYGHLTLLEGDPGCGKTPLTADIAARVTTGRPMCSCLDTRDPANVIIFSAEDATAVLRTKLEAANAELSRVYISETNDIDHQPLLLPRDISTLDEQLRATRAALVILDPVHAFLASRSTGDAAVRQALTPLATSGFNAAAAC